MPQQGTQEKTVTAAAGAFVDTGKGEALFADGGDQALDFVAGRHVEVDEESSRHIRRKIDKYLLPWYVYIPPAFCEFFN